MTGESKNENNSDNRRDSTISSTISAILPDVANLNSQNSINNDTVISLNNNSEEANNNRTISLPVLTSQDPSITVSTQDLTTDVMNSSGNHHHRLFPSLRYFERRTQGRNWRENINNVFQEIRPLVSQSSHNSNSTSNSILATLIPHNRNSNFRLSTNSNDLHIQGNQEINRSTDSIVINMDQSPSTSTISREIPVNSASVNANATITSTGSFVSNNNITYERQNSGPFISNSHSQSQISLHDPSARSQSIISAGNITNNGNNNEIPGSNSNQNGNPGEDPVPESITQIPEAREFINTLCRYTPYVAILFVKAAYDHLDGILYIFALFVTFVHSNFVLRQEISKQSARRVISLLKELIYIILVIVIIGFLLEKNNTLINLIFKPFDQEEEFSLKNLLFSVCITDLILKLFTVACKIIFTLLPSAVVEYKNRGRIYLTMESVSQLYRALAPIQSWLFFLLDSYKGTEKIMGVILAAAYMVAKASDLVQRAKFCKRSFAKLLQKTSFGVTPTKEQVQSAGGICSICHDNYNSPVLLECNHIFCELCVGTWFDRERSCPLCRALVVDCPQYRDGSTTFFLQFY